jgi:hypothetical protein
MELWKILLVIGIILLIIYFYFNQIEFFDDITKEPYKYIDRIYKRSKNISRYPIDIDKQQYTDNLNVKLNRIFGNIVELNNKKFSYPIIFNYALKPIEYSDETNNTTHINSVIQYLEEKFNNYDSNCQIKVNNVNKLVKHLIPNQLQYDILLNITIKTLHTNKRIETNNRDVFMTIIITKYLEEQKNTSYDIYIKSLNLANMDHYQYLTGLDKKIELESLDKTIDFVKKEKKIENQMEVQGLTNSFDPKYPEYSIYETFDTKTTENQLENDIFMPSNNIDRYSNCNSNIVNTEDVLDIFQ